MTLPEALGFLGLKPWEFLRFTIREYVAMAQGYGDKRNAEMRVKAWEIAWIANPHYKTRLTPEKVLPKAFNDNKEGARPTADQMAMLDSIAVEKEEDKKIKKLNQREKLAKKTVDVFFEKMAKRNLINGSN